MDEGPSWAGGGLTCADGDGADELLPPAAAAHHQSQVGLLDQLVYGALQRRAQEDKRQRRTPLRC